MKKLLMFTLALIGFVWINASAQGTYTVNIDDYTHIQKIGAGTTVSQMTEASLSSNSLTVGIYESYNLYIFPAEGYGISQITMGGQSVEVDYTNITTGGYAEIAYVNLAGRSSQSIDITTVATGTSGGGLTWTFNCESDALTFSDYGVSLTTKYENGAYTVTGMTGGEYENVEVIAKEGYTITSITTGSTTITTNYGHWLIPVKDYLKDTTFDVVVSGGSSGETGIKYVFSCTSDVLVFGAGIDYSTMAIKDLYDTTYENGSYTISMNSAGPSIYVGLKSDAEGYTITGCEVNGESITVSINEGKMFAFPTSSYTEGANVKVLVEKSSESGINFVFECSSDVLEFARTFNNQTMELSDFYDVTYNGSYTISLDQVGPSIYVALKSDAEGYTITGCEVNGESITVSINEGKMFAFPTYSYSEGANVKVLIDAPKEDTFVYTFTGAEGISIRHAADVATYSDGVYTLANMDKSTLNNSSIEISVAASYENSLKLVSVTGLDDEFIPAGSSGVIYIPASRLVAEDTKFVIKTEATSGVDSAVVDVENGQAEIYDLRGIKVSNPVSGLYIVNGKKVYVK